MMNFGWLVGSVGAGLFLVLAQSLNIVSPSTGLFAHCLVGLCGGTIATLVWLYTLEWLNIPARPTPSREDLMEATRVDLERRIRETSDVCGSAAEVVLDLQFELQSFNYLDQATKRG